MSRPVLNPEWEALIARERNPYPENACQNESMAEDWKAGALRVHGVSIFPTSRQHPEGSVWMTKLYLAGQSRTIGRGNLYQCCRLYDAALVWFKQYRTARNFPSNFSFGECDCKVAVVSSYLARLEEYLKRTGEPLHDEPAKREARLLTKSKAAHRRTGIGIFDTRLTAIEAILQTVSEHTARVSQLEITIAAVLSRLNVTLPPVALPADTHNFAKNSDVSLDIYPHAADNPS